MTEPPPSTDPPRGSPRPRRPSPWVWLAGVLVLALAVLGGTYAVTRDDDGSSAASTAEPAATTAPPATTSAPATTAAPEPAVVPAAVGKPVADAAEAFAAEGLLVDLFYTSSREPAGTVVAQGLEPGTELQPEDLVQLNVANGPDVTEYLSLPDVGTMPLDEARATLEKARFEVLAFNLDHEIRDTDAVVLQTPEASAAVPPGSLVVLYVTR
jgi:hypothetical protein